ncbi:MAG TPA: hypothetical protein VMR08_01135 [Patescibacteria group bacterium]|jgi:hypothetical protein|nr:hypothetical protein [Patescibacteria group bacterium]
MAKLDELLQKNVTRRQFLTTMALAVTSLFGFSTIIGMLTKSSSSSNEARGYGDQSYGH